MSTKCTIKYSNGKPFDFHFYNEVGDDENVYLQLNGTDYVEIYVRPYVTSGTVKSDNPDNVFGAFRIGA